MQQNTAATTVDWSMIDTGAEEDGKTYYLYGYQATVTDTDFDIAISLSSSAPTGITYYERLGYFYNNSSGNIEQIVNDNAEIDTDVLIKAWVVANGSGTIADDYNVTSITDTGVGKYTITWDVDFVDTNYAVIATFMAGTGAIRIPLMITQATGSITMEVKNNSGTYADPTKMYIMAIGDQ